MVILILIIIIIIVIMIILGLEAQSYNSKIITSDIDNAEYLVNDMVDSKNAANTLAILKHHMILLTEYLNKYKDSKYKKYKLYINRLNERIDDIRISENRDVSTTSYTVNKGEEIVYCLRSKSNNEIHDINLLMYVVLHEMAHVASPIYGHDKTFDDLVRFLINVSIELNIYNEIDFNKNPIEYCGLIISDST